MTRSHRHAHPRWRDDLYSVLNFVAFLVCGLLVLAILTLEDVRLP